MSILTFESYTEKERNAKSDCGYFVIEACKILGLNIKVHCLHDLQLYLSQLSACIKGRTIRIDQSLQNYLSKMDQSLMLRNL